MHPGTYFYPVKRVSNASHKEMACEFQEYAIATMQPGPLLVFHTLAVELVKADLFKSVAASFKFSSRLFSFLKLVTEVLPVHIYL